MLDAANVASMKRRIIEDFTAGKFVSRRLPRNTPGFKHTGGIPATRQLSTPPIINRNIDHQLVGQTLKPAAQLIRIESGRHQ